MRVCRVVQSKERDKYSHWISDHHTIFICLRLKVSIVIRFVIKNECIISLVRALFKLIGFIYFELDQNNPQPTSGPVIANASIFGSGGWKGIKGPPLCSPFPPTNSSPSPLISSRTISRWHFICRLWISVHRYTLLCVPLSFGVVTLSRGGVHGGEMGPSTHMAHLALGVIWLGYRFFLYIY